MSLRILTGDCRETLRTLPDQSVQCCVTSPPYFGLRDYGHDGQIGLEQTPDAYVAQMAAVFREVRRVLKDDGTLWLNLGDSYSRQGGATDNKNRARELAHMSGVQRRALNTPVPGSKPKDLLGIPWRVAFALQADGWYLRQDIIWHKPNPMPESVRDRCTKAHEYIFLMAKSERYFFDSEAMKEPAVHAGRIPGGNNKVDASRRDAARDMTVPVAETRNRRSVWTVTTKPYKGAHFATYPPDLIRPCILAGSRIGDTVLDPFGGSGTTGQVALESGRKAILCELNPAYVGLIEQRCAITPSLAMEGCA